MEVLLLGTIGLIGYAVSEKLPRTPAKQDQPPSRHAHAYPFGPGTEVQKVLDADRLAMQARWQQAQHPHTTGVITPNTKPGGLQPFFSSASKQHTNDSVKQRRLETFTGALDMGTSQSGTYSRKKEVPTMFKPEWTASAVSSSGSSGNTPIGVDQAARFVPSVRQNNVLPTQQVRVGKGVGVGPEVAAADGFHPMLRVMPKNANEHRLNNLPGGVIPGGSRIAIAPAQISLYQQGPPRYWDQTRRPTAATKASVNAASVRPQYQLAPCGGRLVGDDYYGGAGQGGTYADSQAPTRDRSDNNPAMHDTNVTGARHGVGAFAKASVDPARFAAQQREQQQAYGGVLTGHRAPLADPMHLVPETHRSLQSADVMGNPASAVEGGRARPMDPSGRTLREQLHPQAQAGIATPYIRGHSTQGADKWLDRESKRHDQHVVNWMPPPHKASDVRVSSVTQVKPRLEMPVVAALPTVLTPLGMAPLGSTTTPHNKLPPTNARLDLGLAQRQLAGNELHRSIQ